MRHAVYATELGQHPQNSDGRLVDELDAFNHYIVATIDGEVVGFVSITPPGFGRYSFDKYLTRSELPVVFDNGLFEGRILTVDPRHRTSVIATVLMHAARRWVEDHGGRQIIIIGRRELVRLYQRAGFRPLGHKVQAGAVSFELMTVSLDDNAEWRHDFKAVVRRIERSVEWGLAIPFERHPGAFHGGAAIGAIEVSSDGRVGPTTISADVLDAWFPPAPAVLAVLAESLEPMARMSPPMYADQLRDAIAAARGIDPASVLPGAGLSDLIFRALPGWVDASSRVLLIEPQYGEYRHVLQTVIGCQVDGVVVDPKESRHAARDFRGVQDHFRGGYDFIVLVNPNNPLGYRIPAPQLVEILSETPPGTVVWVDETYADFAGADTSVERFAATSHNVVVGKSMSKSYALSGLRVGYLCGPEHLLNGLWRRVPPWSISRPAQLAAIAALASSDYYVDRYDETARLRAEFEDELSRLPGLTPRRGTANFVFCDLLEGEADAATLTERARERGLYIRDFPMDSRLRWHAIRLAVKDRSTNERIVQILADALAATRMHTEALAVR
jgi:histidinol-phosphate/aromatic aminotransferase/cobyric acid decarboxylase-like protein/GNAT superfamily N-acetyltransferase